MTIHLEDPFATPEGDRSPLRRLRGRLAAPVCLWTAPGPAGLTVSSMLVADGDPGRVLGLVDDESELWSAIQESGRFAVAPLREGDRQLADRFAGLMPAPGGPFRTERWRDTGYGPVLEELATWAGCRLVGSRPCGWALLVEGVVEQVEVGPQDAPLVHYRGRYHSLG
jgi:3-hydroxy-9,10-secoandrosta-1,3,5(10)-triene-9,17-dione monooxygenase reductase component